MEKTPQGLSSFIFMGHKKTPQGLSSFIFMGIKKRPKACRHLFLWA